MSKARLIILAVMVALIAQALLMALSVPPVGFFDGDG